MAVNIYSSIGNRVSIGPSSGGLPVLNTQGVELSNLINPIVLERTGTPLVASQIKTLYESNANTNAFTDVLLSKLNGLVAQVNADWNAITGLSLILNKPVIPSIPANIVIDALYVHTDNNYTSTEKSKLSGLTNQVQIDWNSISGISSIANKPANLVIDATYIHTDNNYTTVEKNKLTTLSSPVQPDWAALTGLGSILNKPSIPEDFITGILSGNQFKCNHLYNYPTITISSSQVYSFDVTGAVLNFGGVVAFVANGVISNEPTFSNGILGSGSFDNTLNKVNVLGYIYLPGGIVSYNWLVGMIDSVTVDQTVIPDSSNPVSSSGVSIAFNNLKTINNQSIIGPGNISVASTYILPNASTTILGGIKVGANLVIDGTGVLSSTGNVIGPNTNTDLFIPTWNGLNSKTLNDGLSIPSGGLVGLTALNLKLDSSSFSNIGVTSKLITGFTSIVGTITITDTILQAINKLDGNIATKGTGTITTVSIATGNGISGSSSGGITPSLTINLGAIVPSSVVATGNITGLNLSGINTGDVTLVAGSNTLITTSAGTATISSTISGGGANGRIYYPQNSVASDLAGYKVASTIPSPNITSNVTIVCPTQNVYVLGEEFSTAIAEPNITSLPSGTAIRFMFASTSGGTAQLKVDLFQYKTTGNIATTGAVSFTYAIAKTITRSIGSFITDGFTAGCKITVAGTVSNNGTFTVQTVSTLTLTLILSDILTAEVVSSTITTKEKLLRSNSSPEFANMTSQLIQFFYSDATAFTLASDDRIVFKWWGRKTTTGGSQTITIGTEGLTTASYIQTTLPVNLGLAQGTSLILSGLTSSEILGTDVNKNLVSLPVTTYPNLTELTYVKGVTSAVQTQFTSKAPLRPTITKTVLVDADETTGNDSAATYGQIKTTWLNVKAFLKTYFDTLYQAVLVSGTNLKTVGGTSLLGTGDIPISAIITIDSVPTSGSPNAVASGGTYDAAFRYTFSDKTADYTLALADIGVKTRMNCTIANKVTLPLNSVVPIPIGYMFIVRSIGIGVTSIFAAPGVTINSPNGSLSLSAQYNEAICTKEGTDLWSVVLQGASLLPTVASGEKVITVSPTGLQLNYDVQTQVVPIGTLGTADWSTGQATYTGLQGQVTYDVTYKYECVGANAWLRTSIRETRLDLYLADYNDSVADATSSQLDTAYPAAVIGQKVWGNVRCVYEKKAPTIWKKIPILTA